MNNAIKPDHYRKGRQYQPWDVAKDWDLDFDLGSVLKYIGRCGRKAGNSKIQDLKKAAEFLKHEIDCLEADEPKDENISVEIPEHKWEWENVCTFGTCLYIAYKTKVSVGNEILGFQIVFPTSTPHGFALTIAEERFTDYWKLKYRKRGNVK